MKYLDKKGCMSLLLDVAWKESIFDVKSIILDIRKNKAYLFLLPIQKSKE